MAGDFKNKIMSRLGIIFCSVYALIIIICFTFSFVANDFNDFKGQFVFLQLPLAIQISVIDALGLAPILQNLSWIGSYVILGLPTFLILYFFGKIMD